jgi:salicylate hydroxylase
MRNRWLYAYDAEAAAIERWDEVSSRVEEELRSGKIEPLFVLDPKSPSKGD